MTEPWDIPPPPAHGDALESITHASRSRAIDAWEHVELSIYLLDVVFTHNRSTAASYGSGIIFRNRLNILSQNSCKFFISNPCQSDEGEFRLIIHYLNKYSLRRHDIAHGIVAPWPTGQNSIEYALMPAFYQIERGELERFPTYVYNSEILESFTSRFYSLRDRINLFRNHLLDRDIEA